jgi:SPP1 gp7 family putative phage head morphogenesis protein
VIERHSLKAALKAVELAARRNKLKDIDDISLEVEELLRNNAGALAGHVSESIKASLRQALIEGISANESIQQLQNRVAEQLDSFASVNVRPVIDAQGNVVRTGHARSVSRSSAAELIARTEANRAYNEGNLDALKQAGLDTVVFLLSSDACPECRAVSESTSGEKLGKSMSIDDARELIPVHPNCRCTWIAG